MRKDNQWHCPPGEVYADQFGLYYRIRSDREINWVLQRNLQFLEDYYRAESLIVEEAIAQSLLAVVSSQPGITLAELLNQSTGAKSDDIYTLIAQEQIYIDLNATPLAEPERCLIFRDEQTASAYRLMVEQPSVSLPAIYQTFDSLSYRSCLMVLRICVKRHGRLPQIIVVDNGAEFHSLYFETLLATFESTKKQRPPAKARFGSVCERLFGTSNTQFVHNLLGNTQITRNIRQVTKSVNPKNQAVWTLGLLYEYLCAWAYEVYDTDEHPALFQSPRDAFAAGMAIGGSRVHRMIPYDENFQILTLPTTSEGKAKVQVGRGVKINSIYYWSNSFRDPQIENTSVQSRVPVVGVEAVAPESRNFNSKDYYLQKLQI
jgi:TnsA endonuclease C terminal